MNEFGNLLGDLKQLNKAAKSSIPATRYDIAEEFKDLVKSNTPVDTGALQDDVKHETIFNGELVYNTLDYAPFVEHGHLTRNGKFVKGSHMYEKSLNELEQIYNKNIDELLDKLEKIWR